MAAQAHLQLVVHRTRKADVVGGTAGERGAEAGAHLLADHHYRHFLVHATLHKGHVLGQRAATVLQHHGVEGLGPGLLPEGGDAEVQHRTDTTSG
jgi:hypothetical protein